MDLTEDQWAILVTHNVNRKNEAHDLQMGYLEYIAVLVSPSPKDTLKAIDARHKNLEAKAKHESREDGTEAPIVIEAESRTFKNTTFYDAIAAEVGGDSAEAIKGIFGDTGIDDGKKSVTYVTKPGQMDYFERAITAHQKGEELMPLPSLQTQIQQMHLDALEF